MKHRILVLGGADFIGVRLARVLAAHGGFQPVLAGAVSHAAELDDGIELLPCDVRDQALLTKLVAGVDTVVNCVAGDAETMLRSGKALFAAVASHGGTRVVQLSTMAAYGSATGVVTESTVLLGDVDAYAAARAEVDRMAESHGAVRLRPGIIYGPGSVRWSGQIGALLAARRLGDLGVAGDGNCNLLFIDDLLAVMVRVICEPRLLSGALNLCGAERLTWNEFFIRYARQLGAVPVRRVTARRMKLETRLLAPPLKIAELLLGAPVARRLHVPELLPPSLLRVCSQPVVLDNSKANDLLHLSWTPVEVGLAAASRWFNTVYCR